MTTIKSAAVSAASKVTAAGMARGAHGRFTSKLAPHAGAVEVKPIPPLAVVVAEAAVEASPGARPKGDRLLARLRRR